jgi:hypothetical protein
MTVTWYYKLATAYKETKNYLCAINVLNKFDQQKYKNN